MSNFLDSTGLELLWNKIKATFALKNHTHNYAGYSVMTGATSSASGKSGLVPAPAVGKQGAFLRGDGAWATPTNTIYNAATQSANGLMSSTDKKKLDGIAEGANKITVDSVLSTISSNPIQNKVITEKINIINGNLNNKTFIKKQFAFENVSVPTGGTNYTWTPAKGINVEGYSFLGATIHFTSTSVTAITASACVYADALCLVFTSNHSYTLPCSGVVVAYYVKNDLISTV